MTRRPFVLFLSARENSHRLGLFIGATQCLEHDDTKSTVWCVVFFVTFLSRPVNDKEEVTGWLYYSQAVLVVHNQSAQSELSHMPPER
jgi:hypothetical protein